VAGVRQFDEQATLERALDVFDERGYRAASMLDLAAGTGVQRGSLYHAYGDKEEIFVRAFAAHSTRFLGGAAAALRGPGGLTTFFDYCIDAILSGAPPTGCLSTRAAVEAVTDSGRARAAVRTFLDELENVVHDGLAACDGGDLAVDLRAAARLVVATTRGIAVLERVGHGRAELREIAATLVTTLVGRHC